MPRNSFMFDKQQSLEKNMNEYTVFVREYVQTRRNEGKFINCKIYGNIIDGEVYTTWLFANLPNKKALQLAGAIKEIAPTKQGYPCCIVSKKLDDVEKQTKEKGIINTENNYDFKMVMFSKMEELDKLREDGWEIRKWFDSLKIFTVEDVENGENENFMYPEW